MSELDYARERGTEPEPAEDERVKRLLAEVRQDIAETSPNSSPMGVFRQHCEDLLQVIDGLLPVQPAASTPTEPCRNCGHANPHYCFAGSTNDLCSEEDCNCGYYEPTTTPPDFTEQARQLVERCTDVIPTERGWGADMLRVNAQKLVPAIASALAEAATQGQASAIQRAAQVCKLKADSKRFAAEDGISPAYAEDIELCESLRMRILALSPDPSYLSRVRAEATTAALEQERGRIVSLIRSRQRWHETNYKADTRPLTTEGRVWTESQRVAAKTLTELIAIIGDVESLLSVTQRQP